MTGAGRHTIITQCCFGIRLIIAQPFVLPDMDTPYLTYCRISGQPGRWDGDVLVLYRSPLALCIVRHVRERRVGQQNMDEVRGLLWGEGVNGMGCIGTWFVEARYHPEILQPCFRTFHLSLFCLPLPR